MLGMACCRPMCTLRGIRVAYLLFMEEERLTCEYGVFPKRFNTHVTILGFYTRILTREGNNLARVMYVFP